MLPVDFKCDFYEKLVQKNQYATNYYLRNIIYSEGYRFKENFDIKWNSSDQYTSLLIALPGGRISIQALYNIIENFIRNSAKYQFVNQRPAELNFYFDVKDEDSTYAISFYDSKGNANSKINDGSQTLLELMNSRLCSIRFLEDDNTFFIFKNTFFTFLPYSLASSSVGAKNAALFSTSTSDNK